ncbi:gliding motility-associated C-terminal domain-containing protein [Schleiferiaceae bacterium]|nr:gliding motility-associated C-terminal domain-containing protein [Schleiferiaceae bacterium]
MRRIILLFFLFPTLCFADTYYWVNGAGDWADLTHWATTSGGTTYHNTVPGSGDDVIFDGNSGSLDFTINVNVTTVYTKDFIVTTGAPSITLSSGAVTYELFGSLTLNNGFVVSTSTDIDWNLSGSGSHSIDLNGTIISNLNLNGTGSYQLLDSLNVQHYFGLNSGDFNSNGNVIRVQRINTQLPTGNNADFSNSKIYTTDYWHALNFSNSGTFNFSNSHIIIEGERARISSSLLDTLSLNEVEYSNGVANEIYGSGKLKIAKITTNAVHVFNGIASIDSLYINGGSALAFSEGADTEINFISQEMGCVEPIYLQGSESTSGYEIMMLNPFIFTNASFFNIDFHGAATSATNSVNIFNSSGINISPTAEQDYYWIGGDGSWQDSSHWSLSSGGAPIYCIPGNLDNVIFDSNSSSTDFEVILPKYTHVGDFISTTDDKLDLSQKGGWLAINGSVLLNGATHLNVNTPWPRAQLLLTNHTGMESVNCKNEIRADVTMIGSGSYTVQDSIKIAGVLGVINGHLDMHNCSIRAESFRDRYYPYGGSSGDSASVNISGSYFEIQSTIEFRSSMFTWDYDSSTVDFTGNYGRCYFDESQPFWELRFSNPQANDRINWDGFQAKTVDVHSNLTVNTYQLSLDWDTLRIQEGSIITFAGQPQQLNLEHLDTRTDCFGFATIQAETKEDSITINSLSDSLVGRYVLMKNVTNGTPNKYIKAYSSIDLGGNTAITFSVDQPRTLYWVGNSGVWQDSSHWSLSSGGVGGECIPTPADSVVFDQNSFNAAGQTVDLEIYDSYCGDFVVTPNTDFALEWSHNASLQCFQSMVLQPTFSFNSGSNGTLRFRGADSAYFDPADVLVKFVIQIEKSESATIEIRDSLACSNIVYVRSGGLLTKGNSFYVNRLILEDNGDTTWAEVDSSLFEIFGHWDVFNISSANIGWKSEGAKVYLTTDRSRARVFTQDTVEHIEFTNKNTLDYNYLYSGNGSHIQYVRPHANLVFAGSSSIDTLILTPDQVYSFDASYDHIIHDSLRARGDFCNYIGLKSTQIGSQADLFTYHNVGADFLEIRDINYAGNGVFYTGSKSNDQGNNTGFIWADQPGYVYGFPPDTTELFCHDSVFTDSILLTTQNFNDAVGFLWSTGDTTDQLWVNQSGVYWVEADYVSCKVLDTIQVNLDYKTPLTYDSKACVGDTIALMANGGDNAYNYQWSTGSTGASISLALQSDTTIYVDIYVGNRLVCTDTAHIEGVSLDASIVTVASPSCHQSQDGQIDINSISGGHAPYSYSWSHNSTLTLPSANGLTDGCYVVTSSDTLGCYRKDTICLVSPPPLSADFVITQPFCEEDAGSAVLGAAGGTPGYSYTYNFNPSAISNGNYSYSITDSNGCKTDTTFKVEHTFNFNYVVDIDTAICGENNGAVQVIPALANNAYTYSWSAYPGYTNSGQIFMPVSNGFIYIQDSIFGCFDTVYYEIPAAGLTSAIFLTSQDSGVSPLSVTTTNMAAAPGLMYYWLMDGDTVSYAEDTTFVFGGYGDYLITLCVLDPEFGCEFCYDKWIKVLPNPKFEAPNFFTPNYDGSNDNFELIVGQDLEHLTVEIYNRWDEMVFRSYEIDFKWDGRALNGLDCSPGVYFWVITYREVGDSNDSQAQGTVHLIH